jgi:hypothetical protein
MISAAQINLAHVKAEVEALFAAYEAALMCNDLEILDRTFWHSSFTVRFGTGENLYGMDAIRAFRIARQSGALSRTLKNTQITTYGEDFATTTTEFVQTGRTVGRQSQALVCFAEGWRIVSAHISFLDDRHGPVAGGPVLV